MSNPGLSGRKDASGDKIKNSKFLPRSQFSVQVVFDRGQDCLFPAVHSVVGEGAVFVAEAHRDGDGFFARGDRFAAIEAGKVDLFQCRRRGALPGRGDLFPADRLVDNQRQIPHVVIRSISDNADEGAVLDKQMFYILAARNSADLVAEMVALLEPGSE